MNEKRSDKGQSLSDSDHSSRYLLLTAALAQLTGLVVVMGAAPILYPPAFAYPFSLALLQGFCAMLVSRMLRSPNWWMLIHLIFMPLVVLARGLELPPGIWLAGFVLLLLVFWRTDTSRVPLFLTNRKSAEALLSLLPSRPSRTIDLGCGDGSLLRFLARARPDCSFVGIEHAPLPWAWARFRARRIPNLEIYRKNIWAHSLAGYDLAYAFLSPIPMTRLWAKACAEMFPGACFVSNSFPIREQLSGVEIDVADERRTRLHCYAIPDATKQGSN